MSESTEHPLPLAERTSLPVSETFVSVQGEGSLTGVPSWFLRVSGCNLRCAWCDTPYASWKAEGVVRTIDDLVGEAARAKAEGITHAVLTGGEPMLFAGLVPLAQRLGRGSDGSAGLGMHITVETAGTVFRRVPADLMSISPKLSNSTPSVALERNGVRAGAWGAGVVDGEFTPGRHEERRLNVEALQALLDGYPVRQLKFVVASRADVAEIDEVLVKIRGWRPVEVMLMPEGVRTPTNEWAREVAGLCVARGWRYCHRLHIELFGNARGT